MFTDRCRIDMHGLETKLLHTAARLPRSLLSISQINGGSTKDPSARSRTKVVEPVVIRPTVGRCGVRRELRDGDCEQAHRRVDHHVVDDGALHRQGVLLRWNTPM